MNAAAEQGAATIGPRAEPHAGPHATRPHAMPDEPLLRLNSVGKRFPGVIALQNVSFDVRAGEVHAICGENGAGKSTLMKIVSGQYRPDEGEIYIDGRDTPNCCASSRSGGRRIPAWKLPRRISELIWSAMV